MGPSSKKQLRNLTLQNGDLQFPPWIGDQWFARYQKRERSHSEHHLQLFLAWSCFFLEKPMGSFGWGKLGGCFSLVVFKIQVLFVVSGIRVSHVFFDFV